MAETLPLNQTQRIGKPIIVHTMQWVLLDLYIDPR